MTEFNCENMSSKEVTLDDLNDEDYCLGCETGSDAFYSHQHDGYYHPKCCTSAALQERALHAKTHLGRLKHAGTSLVDFKDYSHDVLRYIDETKDTKFAQDCLDCYARCECCATHKINKPERLGTPSDTWLDRLHIPQCEKECECNCRHIARIICRNF